MSWIISGKERTRAARKKATRIRHTPAFCFGGSPWSIALIVLFIGRR